MFEFLTESSENAFSVLKADHNKAKELFESFEKAESIAEKKSIAAEAIEDLKIHTLIEEEIFYPAVRKHVEKKLMNEADEEHHVAKFLIAELENMDGTEDHYDAKFKVLSENVRHHIREEEDDMFPKARSAGLDFEQLGLKLIARKEYLKEHGIPEMEEDKMIAASGIKNDSPARLSRKPAPRLLAKRAKPAAKKVIRLKTKAKAATHKIAKPVKKAARKMTKVIALPKKKAAKKPVPKKTVPLKAKTNLRAAGRRAGRK